MMRNEPTERLSIQTPGLTARLTALCICVLMSTLSVTADTIAFPGAEGAGKFTKGGRGGDVYHVTNLKDSGPGSLRDGVESIKGPRTIVFDISGMIRLKNDLKIIDKSYLTIAGQTAPGKGITLADRTLQIKNSSHIIVRYLRVRLGDENKPAGSGPDCITVDYDDHIILDHLSLSWGIDGNGDFRGLKHATVQWVIFSEALHDSLHGKGAHAMCTSFRSSQGFATLHHNIYASSRSRHPSVGGGPEVMEFCNNVDYNWGKGLNEAQQERIAALEAIQKAETLATSLIRVTYFQAITKNEFGTPRAKKAQEIIEKELNKVLKLRYPNEEERKMFGQELTNELPPRGN